MLVNTSSIKEAELFLKKRKDMVKTGARLGLCP